jgi:hypothetical protein
VDDRDRIRAFGADLAACQLSVRASRRLIA